MARYAVAIWAPGPPDKQGYPGLAVNAAKGIICHSMVGNLASAIQRLKSDDRASWQFSIAKDGGVLQHYDSRAVAWHAGSPAWNGRLIGIEHEGGAAPNYSEPLTPPQLEASVALCHWLGLRHDIPMVRDSDHAVGLFEHNEVYATACPSHRIPWEDYTTMPLTDDDKRAIAAIVKLEIAAAREQHTQDCAAVNKLTLEQFRQELEAAGQLPPRQP